MTRAQLAVFNRLRHKQTNKEDVTVVEETEACVTIHVTFPGLYLTYNLLGKLISTETEAERRQGNRPLKGARIAPPEMGQSYYQPAPSPVEDLDDDVPF